MGQSLREVFEKWKADRGQESWHPDGFTTTADMFEAIIDHLLKPCAIEPLQEEWLTPKQFVKLYPIMNHQYITLIARIDPEFRRFTRRTTKKDLQVNATQTLEFFRNNPKYRTISKRIAESGY